MFNDRVKSPAVRLLCKRKSGLDCEWAGLEACLLASLYEAVEWLKRTFFSLVKIQFWIASDFTAVRNRLGFRLRAGFRWREKLGDFSWVLMSNYRFYLTILDANAQFATSNFGLLSNFWIVSSDFHVANSSNSGHFM